MEKTNSFAEGSALECAWLDAYQAPAVDVGVSWGMTWHEQVPGPLLRQGSFSQWSLGHARTIIEEQNCVPENINLLWQ